MGDFYDNFSGTDSGYYPPTLTRVISPPWFLPTGNPGYISSVQQSTSLQKAISYTFSNPTLTTGFTLTIDVPEPVDGGGTMELYINDTAYFGTTIESNSTEPIKFTFTAASPGTVISSIAIYVSVNLTPVSVELGPISSTLYFPTCLAPQSKVLTITGYKEIDSLLRGDKTVQGKIARVIEQPLLPEQFVEVSMIKRNSLGDNLPQEDIIACSNHIFIYQGKRILAKELGETKCGAAKDLLSPGKDGKYKLLDIQYDFEGIYITSGLDSQSRSPYCKLTPLPRELYWNKDNYRAFLVDNTLRED